MTAPNELSRKEVMQQLTAKGEDYELVPGEVWGRPCRVFKNALPTLRDLYDSTRSDETFLVYENERYSFEETHQQALRKYGIDDETLANIQAHTDGLWD